MNCSHCQGAEKLFSSGLVQRELRQYRAKGPGKTTRLLTEALKSASIEGSTLLDIGGGIGAIQNELLRAGVHSAIAVDASAAYLQAARQEAERQGHSDRITYQHGDFVDLASHLPQADLVTLEKVICCYPDVRTLVGLSSMHARRLYGFVIPRDTWWMKVGSALGNLIFRLQRNSFRTFVHPTPVVDAVVRANGFERRYYRRTFLWQVLVYARHGDPAVL
jgi:hypothetical protein